jgi:16S rRNA (guanine966-N2)-methyltransferase
LRVIAGKWKGHPLVAPAGTVARPTTDRVKESMFNMMGIGGLSCELVLDLFAGSGALGLEALSRGADRAVFVDESVVSLRAVQENLKRIHAMEYAEVWRADWRKGISRLADRQVAVSWVFLDPPYQKNLWEQALSCIGQKLRITEGIVCEHPKTKALPDEVDKFSIWKHKVYGDIAITIYIPRG